MHLQNYDTELKVAWEKTEMGVISQLESLRLPRSYGLAQIGEIGSPWEWCTLGFISIFVSHCRAQGPTLWLITMDLLPAAHCCYICSLPLGLPPKNKILHHSLVIHSHFIALVFFINQEIIFYFLKT